MGQYSIKDIETLSGIKAHTLRIWEQRYDFLSPHRTDTNIRYYSDEQLKMILNIAVLNKNGYKISKIAEMDADQIKDIIIHLSESGETEDVLLDSLIHAMIDFDEIRFEKTLNAAIIRMGFIEAFEHLLIPFLQRTGLLWSTGVVKPVQEHFMSNLIKRKLAVAIDNQFVSRDSQTRKFVLFLPEGEWHELMLLFTDLILRTHNQEVIYLGCSVPLEDMKSLGPVFNPDYLVTFLTSPLHAVPVQQFLNDLSAAYPQLKVLVGGPQVSTGLNLPANVIRIRSSQEIFELIRDVSKVPSI
jgi:DNA-binding transcriptional MerR regulator